MSGFILESENEGGISALHLQNRMDCQNIGGIVWITKTLLIQHISIVFVPINPLTVMQS